MKATSHAEFGDGKMITFTLSLLKDYAGAQRYANNTENVLQQTLADIEATLRIVSILEDRVRAA